MQPTESETFRVVIPRNGNAEVLLVHEGDCFVLPRVTIPKWQRVAQCVTERARELWNLETVCLFEPTLQNRSEKVNYNKYLVLEARDAACQLVANLQWVSRSTLGNRLASSDEAYMLQEILESADAYNNETLPGPFARTGWLDELMSWTQKQLETHRLRLTGKVSQLNAHPFFGLVRLETNGPAVWFKAVGEPNVHEYALTVELSRQFQGYFPKLVAAHPLWCGWLSEEAPGTCLETSENPQDWKAASKVLGQLQGEMMSASVPLLQMGCRDARLSTLIENIDPFLDVMSELMSQQTSTPPLRLSHHELRILAEQLKIVFSEYLALGIPDCFGHYDVNPGNIVVDREKCVFLDLAEVYFGSPFITFEYLLLHFLRQFPRYATRQQDLREGYLAPWRGLVPDKKIRKALRLTPVIAAFCYAVCGETWRTKERLDDYRIAKFLRSLTRRIAQEMQTLRSQDTQCVNS